MYSKDDKYMRKVIIIKTVQINPENVLNCLDLCRDII